MCRGSVNLADHGPLDAHEWALKIALECVNGVARNADQAVIGICDDVGNKEIYQAMYSYARKHGTGGRYPSRLPQFTDGLHFTPSEFSRPVQAADMLSSVYRRKNITPFRDPRAAKVIEEFWELMHPLRYAGFCRTW